MSHVVSMTDFSILDLDSLATAAESLGMKLVRDARAYRWWGRHVGDYPLPEGFTREDMGRCDHVLRIKGNSTAYEVGVVRRRDGKPGYALVWDFYAGGKGLQKMIGDGPKDCNRLRRAYSVAVTTKAARRQGFRVQQQARDGGGVRLVVMR